MEIVRECVPFFYTWPTSFPLMLTLCGFSAIGVFAAWVWATERIWPTPVVSVLDRQETDEYASYARPEALTVRIKKRIKTEVETPALNPVLTA